MNSTTQELFDELRAGIERLEARERELAIRVAYLREIGVYDCMPRMEHERRGIHGAEYCRLVFPASAGGGYRGPAGIQKLYVGSDPGRVLDAQRWIARTFECETLDCELESVRGWTREVRKMLLEIVGVAKGLKSVAVGADPGGKG